MPNEWLRFRTSIVLETAAGSGVVTRALTPKLSPDASYVVTDLNQPMLDYAAARQAPDNRISWRKADALALPFEDAAFDLVSRWCSTSSVAVPNENGLHSGGVDLSYRHCRCGDPTWRR